MPTVVTSNTSNATAMAVVILLNWVLAHLQTDWVMPPEVSTAAQGLIVWIVGEWVVKRKNAAMQAAQFSAPAPPANFVPVPPQKDSSHA